MDKDREIRRLREYIHLQLRRETKGDNDERSRILFLLEEGITKSRKSQARSVTSRTARRNKKAQQDNAGNQKRVKKIKEEIGRNLHTANAGPYQFDQIYDDVEIDIFPIYMGDRYQVILKSKDTELTKRFKDEEEARLWARNTALKLSKKITQ